MGTAAESPGPVSPPVPARELSRADWKDWLSEAGQPAYRATQIRGWLFERFVADFAEMVNVPQTLRNTLSGAFDALSTVPCRRQEAEDGTIKWLLKLADGETVEAVLLRVSGRDTVCISSQVGCPVRCAFCASGADGLRRDLRAGEIIDQVVVACRELGRRVNNVVVMGMGEPLLNLDGLIPALKALCAADGLGISCRHVTVSTSGIVPGIRALAREAHPWQLALSLHATTDELRARFIPPHHRYPLEQILEACDEYARSTGRMVTLEYAVTNEVNDSFEEAARLAELAAGLKAKINLLPCNRNPSVYRAPSRGRFEAFARRVRRDWRHVTLRTRRGDAIQAACGQLRRRDGSGRPAVS